MESIDAILELEQRDKVMMALASIALSVADMEDLADKKFVPVEESAYDHILSLLNTAGLCVRGACRNLADWGVADADEACKIPTYIP